MQISSSNFSDPDVGHISPDDKGKAALHYKRDGSKVWIWNFFTQDWILVAVGSGGSGSPQTPWAASINGGGFNLSNAGNITLAASKSFSGIGAVKMHADGSALLASTPDYAGQVNVAADGMVSIPFGTSPSNHLDNVVFANRQIFFYALRRVGTDGDITAGDITCEDIFSSTITANGILGDAIGGTDHKLQASGGTFADNVLNIWNGTGGFSAIAFWAPTGVLGNADQYATGFAPDTGTAPYRNSMYTETNAMNPVNPAPNMIWSQFENTAGAGVFNHVRLKMDGTARTTSMYGWTNGAALGPVAFTITTAGVVNLGIGLSFSGTPVVGAQGAAVANATDAATAITQLNALLARLRTHGLIAT